MYTMDSSDPNSLCKKVRSLEEEDKEFYDIQPNCLDISLMQMDLRSSFSDKEHWLVACTRLKEEIHDKINELIGVLREREVDLCDQVEQEYHYQVAKIDHKVTTRCMNRILKKNTDRKRACRTTLALNSDFDFLRHKLNTFGQIAYKEPYISIKEELQMQSIPKRIPPKTLPLNPIKFQSSIAPPSPTESEKNAWLAKVFRLDYPSKDDLLICPNETDDCNSAYNFVKKRMQELPKSDDEVGEDCSLLNPLSYQIQEEILKGEENKVLTDNSSEEDDIEIISKGEVDGLQIEFTPPVPPKKLFRFGKRIPFFNKKKSDDLSPMNGENSESTSCTNSEYETMMKSFLIENIVREGLSSNKPEDEESSRTCLSGASNEGPSAALMSSFAKYLEKNTEDAWLAFPTKRTEPWLPFGNASTVVKSPNSNADKNLDEWLYSRKCNQSQSNAEVDRNWLSADHTK